MAEKQAIRGFHTFVVFFLGLFILFAVPVLGDNTHLNITMDEVVYQNVTFAEDFDLVNQQKSCMVEGTVNVSNTNVDDSTIFDIYLVFSNVDKLTTDFYNVDGRFGTAITGGSAQSLNVTEDIDDTVNGYELPLDLDNDNDVDYAWVTSTHFVFNLSSEDELIEIEFGNTLDPGNTIDLDGVQIEGNRTYGNLTVRGEVAEADTLTADDFEVVITRYLESPIILHIPELRGQDYSTFIYNMSCFGQEPPVNIITDYSNEFHPDITRKVLSGYDWTLNQTVVNNNIAGQDITNLNISMMAQPVEWNESMFPFNLSHLFPLGDYGNVETVDSSFWWWAPDGGTLAHGENVSIRFNMTAPYSVPFSATYLGLVENITYSVDYMLSNLTVSQINASADIDFEEEKRIYSPADDELNNNVTWEIRPRVYTRENITYDLHKVSLWVTDDLNPLNKVGLERTYNSSDGPLKEINFTEGWGNSSHYWYFNYTDGSDPPIVWIEPEWLIANRYGQIKNFTRTMSGEDLYMKYIYVVSGYWLKINKNITNIGEGHYHINTTVQNVGDGWTPMNEVVTVFDFVPEEFDASNWSVEASNSTPVGTEGSDYFGTAYVWNIPWVEGMNSSLGPKRGPNATSPENYTWSVSYEVNGTGTYRVTELYIVGLDPQKVDGAYASPIITIISSIQSHSREVIYVGIIGFLMILNVSNLIITYRINHKISKHMPAPPPKPKRTR